MNGYTLDAPFIRNTLESLRKKTQTEAYNTHTIHIHTRYTQIIVQKANTHTLKK